MKNIVLARVDDRLIHGEVVSVWTPSLNVNRIIVVDDEVAADKFNKRVIKALAPNGVKVNVYGTEKGADILQRDSKDPNERVMILTKTPITYDRMADMGLKLSDVNLGGMGLRGERTPFIKNVACSPDEITSIKNLRAKGVHVYYQLVPEQQVIEVDGYLNEYCDSKEENNMEMTILQAVLCGVVYWLAVGNLPFVGLWSLQRPLVCGAITGLILGHPVQGAVIGATINLVYLGFMSAGGSMPADMGLAGVLGTAYAIVGGLDTDTALALAVPIGILGTIVWAGRMTFDCFFVHMADKYIEEEKYNKIWIANVLLPQILCFCMTAIPCALAAYFGSSYIQGILAMLSGKVLTVFQIIGGLMPALGIAITLQYIFKGESKVFLFIGFLLAVYSKLPLLTLGIIALLVAVVYVQVTSAVQPATAGADYDDEDDEEDD